MQNDRARGQITSILGQLNLSESSSLLQVWVCRTGEPAGLMGDFKLVGAFPAGGGTAIGVAPGAPGAFTGLATAAWEQLGTAKSWELTVC